MLMFSYAVWRLFEGLYGLKVHQEDPRWKRIVEGYVVPFVSAIVYISFAASSIKAIDEGVDGQGNQSDDQKKKEWTVRVASVVIGQIFLTLISVILFAVALGFLYIIFKRSYQRDLKMDEVERSPISKWAVLITASLGMLGRAILFGSLGILLIRVAWQRQQFTAGFKDALNQWQLNGVGKSVIVIDGILLIIFGLFSLLQARYKNFISDRKNGDPHNSFKGEGESPSSSNRESPKRIESSPV
eukprot:TRINITY_DN2024_c0_g1_i1.p1 TRINITY_DN2024_c0_g1~~TRINITY_DN2024_c0_g1_i1.p1  ORF type:complete len:243 (+),score=51.18 TRINITY_DN2024_c0_g1_i1:388-1116(+)